MKVHEFIELVNSLEIEKFSDIPEDDVNFICSGYDERWNSDETYSTVMSIYECEDGFVGCRGLGHCTGYSEHRPIITIRAQRVEIELKPVYVVVDD